MKRAFCGVLIAWSLQAGTIFEVTPQIGSAGDVTDPAHSGSAATSGVARLSFSTGILCSGAAISPTVILTAAHCIGSATSATAHFTDSGVNTGDFAASSFLVHPSWNGNTTTSIDLALVYLTSPLASWVSIYELYTGTDEIGQTYQVAGWGEQSSNGLPHGSIAGAGSSLKTGNNMWDGTWSMLVPSSGRADILVSDFDDGTDPNNSWHLYFPALTNAGVANEVTIAPGDSGGPSFLNGRVAAVSSFSAGLVQPTGAYGEFNGMLRVSSHAQWIADNADITLTPEPASLGLVGLAACALYFRVRRTSGASAHR